VQPRPGPQLIQGREVANLLRTAVAVNPLNALRYKCHTCEDWHEGLPSPGWDYPLPYLGVPEAERGVRIKLTTDTCVIDGREFFVRANLPIHIHQADQDLSWGVWVSLSGQSFRRFQTLFGDEGRVPGESFFGWFCVTVPGYPDTQLLKTRIHIQPWPERPLVELEPTGHPLAVDYREGITVARALELVRPFVARAEGG